MFKKDIISENPIDLKNIIYNEIDCSIPVLLISAPGYDPSKKIENISKNLDKSCVSIAIGGDQVYFFI